MKVILEINRDTAIKDILKLVDQSNGSILNIDDAPETYEIKRTDNPPAKPN